MREVQTSRMLNPSVWRRTQDGQDDEQSSIPSVELQAERLLANSILGAGLTSRLDRRCLLNGQYRTTVSSPLQPNVLEGNGCRRERG